MAKKRCPGTTGNMEGKHPCRHFLPCPIHGCRVQVKNQYGRRVYCSRKLPCSRHPRKEARVACPDVDEMLSQADGFLDAARCLVAKARLPGPEDLPADRRDAVWNAERFSMKAHYVLSRAWDSLCEARQQPNSPSPASSKPAKQAGPLRRCRCGRGTATGKVDDVPACSSCLEEAIARVEAARDLDDCER